nr:immunoglobulin heavy chain junction region [Macaca mulatta]MOY21184.1 immunoglobulin heavy chain junction region [Macaca mulatta]MOY22220.1 immunoglobulin heavy chain junction region [Macaca mulatta]MOY22659.1 immunoglobulin heavy chain junction region [Macaca mulatta]MOY27181.1 immunoglobulin heavy chain junction region [Macaca mulatta]
CARSGGAWSYDFDYW